MGGRCLEGKLHIPAPAGALAEHHICVDVAVAVDMEVRAHLSVQAGQAQRARSSWQHLCWEWMWGSPGHSKHAWLRNATPFAYHTPASCCVCRMLAT